jgi:hypothetical protein
MNDRVVFCMVSNELREEALRCRVAIGEQLTESQDDRRLKGIPEAAAEGFVGHLAGVTARDLH